MGELRVATKIQLVKKMQNLQSTIKQSATKGVPAHCTCVRLLGCLSCTSVCILVCVGGCISGCMSAWHQRWSLTLTLDHGPKCLHKETQRRGARIGRLS